MKAIFSNLKKETIRFFSTIYGRFFSTIYGRVVILCTTFILLGFVYISPPIDFSDQFKENHPQPTVAVELNSIEGGTLKPTGEGELLKLEFAKAVDEIKFLLQLQDTWYNYKYLFIGAMLAILLGQAGLLKYLDEASHNQNIKSLKEIFSNGLIYLTITFACVICVMIDMHIRQKMLSIQSLGLWIYYYAEPAFMGNITEKNQFIPWERFLRLDLPEEKSVFQHLWQGAHVIALSNQLHFLSTVAYLLYTVIFQQMCLDFTKWRDDLLTNRSQSEENIEALARSRKMIILLGFIFVHLSTLVLTLIIHSVNPKYKMQLFPFHLYASGWGSFFYYSIFWVATVALSLPFLISLLRQPDTVQIPAESLSKQQQSKNQ